MGGGCPNPAETNLPPKSGFGVDTLGTWNGMVVFMVHTPHGDADHIISIRKANKHEANYYWSQYPRPR